jgi:hypothetical protein
VKELESLVEKMVGSHTQDHNDNNEDYLGKDVGGNGRMNGLMNNDDNGIRVSFTNKHTSNGQTSFDASESSDSESERNYLEESMSGNFLDGPNERCLYEEPCGLVKAKTVTYPSLHRNGEVAKENALRQKLGHREKSVDSASDSSSTLDSEHCEKDSESTLYERCCDFVNNGCGTKADERGQVYLKPECTENEVNRVGQCSKVYTHKKRKVDGDNNSKRKPHFEKALPQPLTSNRIDLIDESTNDDTPVTLKTNLDTESSDYLLSFNSESIQSIVGCSLTDFYPSNTFELLNARAHATPGADEKDSVEEEDRPPVLRRSVRLNQQESEETDPPRLKSKLRDDKKSQSATNIKLFSRTKRKNKELERRVPNVKLILTAAQPGRKSHSRPLRKASKIVGRCATKNHHLAKSDKDMVKPKAGDKLANTVSLEKLDMPENYHASEAVKPNTTASVNRALWGDMSDVAEDGEVDEEFLEYSSSAEIPFAVGLLPLRAALERMQATLDHQPRKTRSSVASTKQESSGLKRKNSPTHQEISAGTKKQNANDCVIEDNPSAVCHIQIRTSPQCSRPRKRSLSDGAATLGHTTVSGRP